MGDRCPQPRARRGDRLPARLDRGRPVTTPTTSTRTRYTALSPRLAQALPLIADGLTDDEIAARLGVTSSSVRGYAFRLVDAYSATSRAHMIACAFRQGDLS